MFNFLFHYVRSAIVARRLLSTFSKTWQERMRRIKLLAIFLRFDMNIKLFCRINYFSQLLNFSIIIRMVELCGITDAGALEGHAKGNWANFSSYFIFISYDSLGGNAPTNRVIKETAVIAKGYGFENRCLRNKGIYISIFFHRRVAVALRIRIRRRL